MKRLYTAMIASAAMLMVATAPAHAAVRVFDFTGIIKTYSDNTTVDNNLNQKFSGQVSYDPDLFPTNNFGPQDQYRNAITVKFDTVYGSASGLGSISVFHNFQNVGKDSVEYTFFPTGDFDLATFSSTDFPETPVGASLPSPDGKIFSFGAQGRNTMGQVRNIGGTATFATAVPEPATWAMMVIGFGATGAALRRRKRVVVTYA